MLTQKHIALDNFCLTLHVPDYSNARATLGLVFCPKNVF